MFNCLWEPFSHCLLCFQTTQLEVPNIPQDSDKGVHTVTFDPTDLYIDRDDFKEVIIKCLYCLTAMGTVSLCTVYMSLYISCVLYLHCLTNAPFL